MDDSLLNLTFCFGIPPPPTTINTKKVSAINWDVTDMQMNYTQNLLLPLLCNEPRTTQNYSYSHPILLRSHFVLFCLSYSWSYSIPFLTINSSYIFTEMPPVVKEKIKWTGIGDNKNHEHDIQSKRILWHRIYQSINLQQLCMLNALNTTCCWMERPGQ